MHGGYGRPASGEQGRVLGIQTELLAQLTRATFSPPRASAANQGAPVVWAMSPGLPLILHHGGEGGRVVEVLGEGVGQPLHHALVVPRPSLPYWAIEVGFGMRVAG